MSAAAVAISTHAATSVPLARRITWALLALATALAVVLLIASLVPSAILAGRLMGAAGEARAGAYTQDLTTSLDDRLRLAGGLFLMLLVGLTLTRTALEELVAASLEGIRVHWPTRDTLVLVGAPTLAAVALRNPFLSQPMRYDEALTFNEFASRPLYYGLSFYPEPNNHLLNTLLMHATFLVLGNQPWVLRLPAFLAGVLLVPATFWLASELFGRRAAVLAAALVGVSSYLVEYSTNARGYTLQALCFVVMLALLVRGARRSLLAAAVVAALGAYAVPTMLYGVVIAATWLVLRRTPLKYVVATGAVLGLLVAILYLPVVVISGPDKLVSNRFVVPLGFGELTSELGHSLAQTWAFWNRDIPLPLAVLLAVGFSLVTADAVRHRKIPLGLVAPLVCLVLVVLQRVAPFERVWLFLLPLYFIVASAGLARFVDGRLLGAVFGVVLGYVTLTSGSILSSAETGVFPDAENVARTLGPRLAPDDAVTTTLPASLPELQYYFPRFDLPIDVLVRDPSEGQNLWVVAPLGAQAPAVSGWANVTEVERFSGSELFELKRS